MLQSGNLRGVSESLPSTVKSAIDQPPISEVMKITGRNSVVRFIEFELIKMTTLISVGNNLNNSQVEFIATQLVEMFPNESMADFKICFQRGCIGQYGEIFRMDGIVLRKWMESYLDEKYQHVEEALVKEKDKPYEKIQESEEGPGYKLFKKWANELAMGTKVPATTDADNRKYGQKAPAKKDAATAGYKYFTVRNLQILALTQEHAEQLVQRMIETGDLIEDNETQI